MTLFYLLSTYTVYAKNSPVFIAYHRFGESEYPSTNTTIEQLESHIKELKSSKYKVLPIIEIVKKIRNGEKIEDRTIGISVDDGFRSIYEIAWPRFKAANLPITVFLSTAFIESKNPKALTWKQIREMKRSGVLFENHSHSHSHMPKYDRTHNENDIMVASEKFRKELAYEPKLFAYPYGETSLEISNSVKNMDFLAAFGQHSGVISSTEELFNIPRFAINEKFGNLKRFRLIINALPLHISDFIPKANIITHTNPPLIGFTLNNSATLNTGIQCFTSHAGKSRVELIGKNRIEVRINSQFPPGRTRLNCTLRDKSDRWRWLGRMFLFP